MFKAKLKELIRTSIENAFNEVFNFAHEFAGTTSGDITIDQRFKLGEIKEELHALVYEQVMQNMTEKQLAAKGEGSLVDQKFSQYLEAMEDQVASGLLREMAFSLDEKERRIFLIEHLPEMCGAVEDEPSEEVLWNVPVTRVGYGYSLVAVNARTEKEAIEKALDAAGDEEYSEKSSEYITPDGAHKIG